MLRRVLRLADYEVALFDSGEAFLSSLESTPAPACVILDVHMPRLSGFDVQSRLRAAQLSIPIVFVTASADPSLDDAVLEADGVALLRKPFSSSELLDAVRDALLRKPRERSNR